MAKSLLKSENSVELIENTLDGTDAVAYVVKDRRRTPETWPFGNYADALAKYLERVENAKRQPPILPR